MVAVARVRRAPVAALLFACAFAPCTGAQAATVSALALPPAFTVKPEGENRLISIAPNHTVAALAESTDRSFRVRAFRWKPTGSRSTFTPLSVTTAPDGGYSPDERAKPGGIATGSSTTFVSAFTSWSGAYSGTSYEVQRWVGDSSLRWPLPDCVSSGDSVDQHANAVDPRGRLALTIDRTGQGSFMVMSADAERYAPYAYVIDRTSCRDLGRAVVLNVRDRWAAGYVGYLDGHRAPTNLDTIIQRPVALRWHDRTEQRLGEGAAYAVTSRGLAVGATAVAGRFQWMYGNWFGNPPRRTEDPVPHARAWDARGHRIALVHGDKRSVAYDVTEDGTVYGMVQAADGRHYAFRWRAGRLQRLDDLPHPPGWRFESAYAVAPDGTVAGVGTHDGVPTVFTWHE